MRKLRFFCEHINTECLLDASETKHLYRVLRAKEGDSVELFDGQGTLADAVVTQIDKKQTTLRASNISRTQKRSEGRIILAVSFAKGQRFDWLVEKCTELGVDHIVPTIYHRTVKLVKSSVAERLQKVAMSAVKQSGRLFVPNITAPSQLEETVKLLRDRYPHAKCYFGEPDAASLATQACNSERKDLIVFIGPEGGLTDDEIQYLRDSGVVPVSVNPGILRIETAAVAFCAILASSRTS